MPSPTSHLLDVPGARLYYEIQGSGPTLVLIGHPMGASGFAAIAPLLADNYTVVTYDPRGFARSTIEDSGQDGEPNMLADDVRRVLEAVGGTPAHVFGSSGGAVTGIALVGLFPGLVHTLVAHEPPLALLLPEADDARSGIYDVYDTYRNGGTGEAWTKFFAFTGMTPPPQNGGAEPEPAEAVATSERFFGHGLLPIALYEPDFSALQGGPARVVVAGGTTSKGEFPQRTAAAFAERLGTTLIDFPGGHDGFATDAREFATCLRLALA
jgi:clorobiocin biosynthesis protein CloN7